MILSTYTRRLTLPFSTSQLPKNTYESSFKYFIKYLVDVREISKFNHKQDRLRPKQNQWGLATTKDHNFMHKLTLKYKQSNGLLNW